MKLLKTLVEMEGERDPFELPQHRAEKEKDQKIKEVFNTLRQALDDARHFAKDARSADDWNAIANDLMMDVANTIEIFDR